MLYQPSYGKSKSLLCRYARETVTGDTGNMWSEKFLKGIQTSEYSSPVAIGVGYAPSGRHLPQQSGFPSEPEKKRSAFIRIKASFSGKNSGTLKRSSRTVQDHPNGHTVMICCWNEYLDRLIYIGGLQ